jgi:hypothetical protein
MATRAKITAVKAAVLAVINQHNAYRDNFNPAAVGIFPFRGDSTKLGQLQAKLDEVATKHNESIPLITAARDEWNAMVPDDPLPTGTALTVSVPTASPGSTVTVAFSNQTPAVGDWIGMFAVGAPSGAANTIDWFWTNGTKTSGTGPMGLSSGSVQFVVPGNGSYEFRLFSGSSYTNVLATSAPVAVATTTQPPGTESPDMTRGASVTDRWGNVWSYDPVTKAVLRNGVTFTNAGTVRPDDPTPFFYFRRTVFMHGGNHYAGDWYQWFWTSNPVAGQAMPLGDYALVWSSPVINNLFATGYGYPQPSPNESAHGTRGQTFTDLFGAVWTFGAPTGDGNLLCLRNGAPVAFNGSGVEYTYMNHTPVVKSADGVYWSFDYINYGGAFEPLTTHDPLLIEAGTVTYGAVGAGMRDSVAEADLATAPETIFHIPLSEPSMAAEFGFTLAADLPGLHSFTKWADRGNADVLRVGGKPWRGQGMIDRRKNFPTPRTSAWLHTPICIDPRTAVNMHEQGIKLSGIEGSACSVRMEVTAPYEALPNHFRPLLYIYDASSGSGFGQGILSNAFIKAGQRTGMSLYIELNTFTNGVANADGKYIFRMGNQEILRIENRLITNDPAARLEWITLQAYHGGMGCPYAPVNDPAGTALIIEYSTVTVATQDPGCMKATTPVVGPSPSVEPSWMQGTQKYVPKVIAGSSAGYWPGQWQYSGWAADKWNGNALARTLWIGGHALNNDNSVKLIDFAADQPTIITEVAASSSAVQGEAYATSPNPDHYSDLLPASGHAYWSQWHLHLLNKAVRFAFTASQPEARSTGSADWLDTITKVASRAPGIIDFLGLGQVNWISVYAQHRISGDVYYHNGGNVGVFRQSDAAWHAFGGGPPQSEYWSYCPGIVDDILGRFLAIGNMELASQDLVTTAYLSRIPVLPDPAVGRGPRYYEYNGAEMDPDNHLYGYVCPTPNSAASELWTIEPQSGQSKFIAQIAACGSGPCNRFTHFPALGGFIIQPDGDAVYVRTVD